MSLWYQSLQTLILACWQLEGFKEDGFDIQGSTNPGSGTQRCWIACGTDGMAEANGGATMAPCTPGTPTPLTPPIFQAKLFAVDSRS